MSLWGPVLAAPGESTLNAGGKAQMGLQRDVRRGNACAALSDEDFSELERIARYEIGSGSFLVSATTKIGEIAVAAVPDWVIALLQKAITPALMSASTVVAKTHIEGDDETWVGWLGSKMSGEWFHKIASAVSGGIGGSAGLPTAMAELGVSTALILRSIQDVAKSYGHDLSDPMTLAECVAVLGRGGPSKDDDEVDVAYWTMRAGLKKAVNPALVMKAVNSEAAQKAAASATMQQLLNSAALKKIFERYGIVSLEVFSEKAVPVLGAFLGAFTNYQFTSYYQSMAHVVYRLKPIEERYEDGQVDACYQRILLDMKRKKLATSASSSRTKPESA